jgi:hypothetical protein
MKLSAHAPAAALLAASVCAAAPIATPKVAALDYNRDTSADHAQRLSYFPLVIYDFTPTSINNSGSAVTFMNQVATDALSTSSIVPAHAVTSVQYVNAMEMYIPTTPGTDFYPIEQVLDANHWWAYDRTTGAQGQYVGEDPSVRMTNFTAATGYAAAKAQFDYTYLATLYAAAHPLRGLFMDNVMELAFPLQDDTLHTADYPVSGSNPAATLTAGSSSPTDVAVRNGMLSYASDLAAQATSHGHPAPLIFVNAVEQRPVTGYQTVWNSLSSPEYHGAFDGALLECRVGWMSYSVDNWGDFKTAVLDPYVTLTKNVKTYPIFQSCPSSLSDYKTARYGLMVAMLGDGYYAATVHSTNPDNYEAIWLDEFNAPVGSAFDPVPSGPVSGTDIWMRRYDHAIVLLNHSTTMTESVPLPSPVNGSQWKHIDAGNANRYLGQDTVLNDGSTVGGAGTSVSLAPKTGLLLISVR